ncbi:MAG: manganese efflux pump MntP family protein [Bacteroidetes bacterium]|nr:manganese efflux pump MntP family protein [Bacteroidota bacterium]MCL2301774.1 manganese efflux pump MntP family protein [Lentimicrobiaceae bacterium]
MGLPEIILIALGLAMDAFAVSIILGLSVKKPGIKEFLLPGIVFGFFQALMPLIGYFAGTHLANKFQVLDHWIAFILLGIIGGKMIKDSFSKKEEKVDENPFQITKILLLAIATSIDALAVGVTFAFLKINIIKAIIIIGLITLCLSMAGIKIGNIFGVKYKSKAEFIGGAILVLLGVKILVSHSF